MNPQSSQSAAIYNPGLHRFTIFLSFCVFFLIVAGALVTSNDAGLAVPDWPTSFGSIYKIPPMVGGIKYEHSHRMVAEICGLLTILLAVWTQRKDRRAWMRKLGWVAVLMVAVQGVLGGLTVLNMLPWYISTAHAMLAQTYFVAIVMMAIFQSRGWIEQPVVQAPATDGLNLRTLSVLSIASVYLQLFLGGAFRHGGMHFLPHLIGAGIATAVILVSGIRAISGYPSLLSVKAMGMAILTLLVAQLMLGSGAYMTRVVWGRDAVQPRPSMVVTTVAHVAVGAMLLAHCFMLAVQVYRNVGAPSTSPIEEQKAVAA